MPYIIAVLALIVVGVGYTLFQTQPTDSIVLDTQVLEVVPITSSSTPTTTDPSPEKTTEVETTETESPTPKVPSAAPTPNTPTTNNPTPKPVTPSNPAPAPADTNTYKNGTYRAQQSYRTPDGTYQMDVSLTFANDTVTSASLSFDADGARDGYSKRFSNSYQSQVIGKSVAGLNLARVGGASLTTKAFNNAVANIRSQAS